MARSNTRSGKNLKRRNNQLAQNGLLYDEDGNTYDLTDWYKRIDSLELSQSRLLDAILLELKKMNLHLQIISDEDITNDDLN